MVDATAPQSSPEFTLDLVILDCPDPMALAQFYSTLLGWPLEEGSDDHWATLVPPGGGVSAERPDGRATLAFQRIDDFVTPTWPDGTHPQQFHLDISVADIDSSESSVLAAGATVHEHQPAEDGAFASTSTQRVIRSASSVANGTQRLVTLRTQRAPNLHPRRRTDALAGDDLDRPHRPRCADDEPLATR